MQQVYFAKLTPEQIASFNEYQASGVFHPFTCAIDCDSRKPITAVEEGLRCECGYVQFWAWDWMLNGDWKKLGAVEPKA